MADDWKHAEAWSDDWGRIVNFTDWGVTIYSSGDHSSQVVALPWRKALPLAVEITKRYTPGGPA